MDAVWIISGREGYYLVPDDQLIINKQGELHPFGVSCFEPIATDAELAELYARASVVVLVVHKDIFDPETLYKIPANKPKVALLLGDTPHNVRAQLTALSVDGYASIVMDQPDYALVLQQAVESMSAFAALQGDVKNYSDIAFTAMSSASEMGVVAVFAEKVQEAMDLERLAKLTLSCTNDFGLTAYVQFAFDKDITRFPANISPTYRRLLEGSIGSTSRIVSHGRFLLFSFTQVQLLIIDAPVDEEDRYGRLRDVLAYITSIAESRAKTLKVNSMLKAQQDNTRMVMMLLEMSSRDNRDSVKEIMTDLSVSLRTMAMGMDLTLEQEREMLGLAEKALNSLEGLQEATSAVEEHFRSLLEQLDNVASLLEHNTEEEEPREEEQVNSKVELF